MASRSHPHLHLFIDRGRPSRFAIDSLASGRRDRAWGLENDFVSFFQRFPPFFFISLSLSLSLVKKHANGWMEHVSRSNPVRIAFFWPIFNGFRRYVRVIQKRLTNLQNELSMLPSIEDFQLNLFFLFFLTNGRSVESMVS